MEKLKRIQWLDFDKGLAIFFVVFSHCPSSQNNSFIINSLKYITFLLVMPIFFTISGFLYNRVITVNDYLMLLYKKVVSFLIPLAICIVIFISCNIFVYGHISMALYDYPRMMYLWFLVSLFLIFCVIGLLDLLKVKMYIQLLMSLILPICSTDFWICTRQIPSTHIGLYMIYSYPVFFFIGEYIKGHFYLLKYKKAYIFLFILALMIQLSITPIIYSTNDLTIVDMFTKIFGVLAVFSISRNISHNCLFRYFDKYGKGTFVIYLVHWPIYLLIGTSLPFVISFICSWLISIFIYYLSLKFSIINFMFYPRKYINKLLRI